MKLTELFVNADTWTRCAFARLPNHNSTIGIDENACCWCLDGAVDKIAKGGRRLAIKTVLEDEIKLRYPNKLWIDNPLWQYNDQYATFADIISICKTVEEKHPLLFVD